MNMPPKETRNDAAPHDEPEITQEESVPSDGRDHEGEELMKQVSNPRLADPSTREPDREKTPAGRSI